MRLWRREKKHVSENFAQACKDVHNAAGCPVNSGGTWRARVQLHEIYMPGKLEIIPFAYKLRNLLLISL